jgi:hypothetical protein
LVKKKLFLAVKHGVLAVKKFSITGFLTIDDLCTKKYFALRDQVWMIMEELFNKRRLSLSKSGLIWSVRETDHIFDEVKYTFKPVLSLTVCNNL